MNPKPIESARDPDLSSSLQAIRRAAQRAREVAARTGTTIVIADAGVIREIAPVSTPSAVQEPAAPYRADE